MEGRNVSRKSARPELASRCSGTAFEMVEHEQPDRRRQIALLAIVIDRADQLRQRHAALRGNIQKGSSRLTNTAKATQGRPRLGASSGAGSKEAGDAKEA